MPRLSTRDIELVTLELGEMLAAALDERPVEPLLAMDEPPAAGSTPEACAAAGAAPEGVEMPGAGVAVRPDSLAWA
jgi:hypothetical protein